MALCRKYLRRPPGIAVLATTFFIVTTSPASNAQSFSLPGRMMREQTAPPLETAPATPTPNRSSSDWGRLFKAQVERCWKRPYTSQRKAIEAIFSLRLKRDGTVETLNPIVGTDTSPYGKTYMMTCLRAIVDCQPYDLPQDAYDEWRFFEPVFTERRVR